MAVIVGPLEPYSRVPINLARHFLGETDEYVRHRLEIAYRNRDVLRRPEV